MGEENMKYAIVIDGVVQTVVEGDVDAVYPPNHIGCGGDVRAGFEFRDGVFIDVPRRLSVAEIDAQIAALEGSTERGVRETLLFLTVAEAARMGIDEPTLYATNYGYKKAKDKEIAIAALRAQRA